MSQIFHRNSNIYSRLSILAVLGFVLTLVTIVALLHRSGYNTRQNDYIEQPIQFSHAHHVGGMGIDCRYCHTTVEKSTFANIPPSVEEHACAALGVKPAPASSVNCVLGQVVAGFADEHPGAA